MKVEDLLLFCTAIYLIVVTPAGGRMVKNDHEAASETYIPLLDALYDLKEEGCRFKINPGITPVLVEQLADPLVIQHLLEFIEDKIRRAKSDIARFEKSNEGHLLYLAVSIWTNTNIYWRALTRDLNVIWSLLSKKMQDEEYVEIATSAATHAIYHY